MYKNKINLMNMVAIAICFASLTAFLSCENDPKPSKGSLIGKWVTSDYHAGNNDTIVFKENSCLEKYFDNINNQEYSSYMTYSSLNNKITFTAAFYNLPQMYLNITQLAKHLNIF